MSTKCFLCSSSDAACTAWAQRLKTALEEKCGVQCVLEADALAGSSAQDSGKQLESLRSSLSGCDWCLLLVTPSLIRAMCDKHSWEYAEVGGMLLTVADHGHKIRVAGPPRNDGHLVLLLLCIPSGQCHLHGQSAHLPRACTLMGSGGL